MRQKPLIIRLLTAPPFAVNLKKAPVYGKMDEEREANVVRDAKPPEEGFSPDGYIRDQDCFSGVRYRTMPASINGCGWIAAYNLLHALGQTSDWEQVLRDLDGMHRLRVPGPTLMAVMRDYLRRCVPQIRETAGREAAVAAAAESAAGIFRYREGREPHFICFLRTEDRLFRFFNVTDGREDCRMSMEQFAAEHLLGGNVTVFTVAQMP